MMMMHRNNLMHHNKFGVINNNFRNTHNNDGRHRFFKIWDTVFEVEAKYVPKDAIGRGAYGVVCSCVNTLTNEKVAIKKINVVENSNEALKALRELIILGHVRHENVIALKDVMIPSAKCKDVYLVFELMDGDLGTFIDSSPPLSNFLIQSFVFQLLNGVDYLHSCNIIHRDLKPGNVLLNKEGRLKICDFGLATTTKGSPQAQPVTENFGTPWYKAPELLLNCFTYGPSIDIWSVGCIFAELLRGEPLFAAKDKLGELIKIMNIVGTPGIGLRSLFPDADPLGLDLLSKMLAFDPNERITAAEALQHPYINLWTMYYPRTSQPFPFPCQVDVEANVGVDKIRKMIWEEMLLYHPEAAFH